MRRYSFFQWPDILQVIIPRSSALAYAATTGENPLFAQDDAQTNCPICLSPPSAPRMTKCGHVSHNMLFITMVIVNILSFRYFASHASCITWVPPTKNGPDAQFVLTQSMSENSSVSSGSTNPSMAKMRQLAPALRRPRPRPHLTTLLRLYPSWDRRFVCASCNDRRLQHLPSHGHLPGLLIYCHLTKPHFTSFLMYIILPSSCLRPPLISFRISREAWTS